MSRQISDLHFDLSDHSQELEFRLLTGVANGISLNRYADHPSKMDEHRSSNAALALLAEDVCGRITHFVEGVNLPARGIYLQQIVSPSLDEHPLPELHMAAFHIGERDVQRALRDIPGYQHRQLHTLAMANYGVQLEQTMDSYTAAHVGAANVKPAGVTAQTLVTHHPELNTADGAIKKYVMDTYVSNTIAFSDLVQYLQRNGPGTQDQWYNKSWSMWSKNPDGTGGMVPAEPNLDLVYQDSKKQTDWPVVPGTTQQGLPAYQLTDEYDPPAQNPTAGATGVVEAAAPIVQEVLKLTKDDQVLQGALWNRQDGTTDRFVSNNPPTLTAPSAPAANAGLTTELAATAGASSSASQFAVKDVTSAYGLWIYDDERTYDPATKTFTLPVKNWPSRYLGAYVQFLEANGDPIDRSKITASNPADPSKPFTWEDKLPFPFLKGIAETSNTKNYLTFLGSGAAILGIPVPPLTQNADLAFLWPDAATHAKVLVGGLGCAAGFSDWDADVDIVGLLGTCLVNYGVGVITLVAGVYIVNPFIEFLKSEWGTFAFFAVVGVIGAPFLVTGIALNDQSAGKMILSKMSGIAASVLFGKASERIITQIAKSAATKIATELAEATGETVAEISAETALEQVPIAGWALKIASIAADLAALAATTVESVLSPATYEIDVLRTMDLTVTVKPDPAHGKAGFNPVWPAVSEHYVVQVTYPGQKGQAGGTTYTKAGPMPGQSDQDITIVFEGIPAGGKIDVSGNIYSDTDWVCGRWSSGWMNALPDDQGKLSTSGSIKEFLVPLTPTTNYSQKQTVAYDAASKHHWNVSRFGIMSTLTTALDAGGTPASSITDAFAKAGNSLSTAATIAVVAVGQQWTITDPTSGDSFGLNQHEIYSGKVFDVDLSSVQSALDAGGATPSSLATIFDNKNYPLPASTTITVATAGQSWSIAPTGQPPLFTLSTNGSKVDVAQASYEITVQNTARPAPPLPAVYPLPQTPTGNQVGALQNIIHNNKEYELGYAWMASGQNLPLDDAPANNPSNVPMYAMQSISTLGQPQDQIIEPTRGFSQPTLIAYDQFGLTELFPLDISFLPQVVPGPVPTTIADEFAAFSATLPADAKIVVLTAGSDWTIDGTADGTVKPLFQMQVVTDDDKKQHIGVFSYPVPGLDNFYLDPRDHTAADPVYYLRGVDLKQGPGEFSFDYDKSKAWGRIVNTGSLQSLAVHPHGYVVGVDFVNHKMYALKLPAEAVASDQAPYAMPLSGAGVLEGLMMNPQALTITADGRILILEEGNRRIQAFDIKGNPVSCFSAGQPSFTVAKSFAPDLDSRQVSTALLSEFQKNTKSEAAPKFTMPPPAPPNKPPIPLDPATVKALDAGTVVQAFVDQFVDHSYAKTGALPNDFKVDVTAAGTLWLITNTQNQMTFDVRLLPDNLGDDLLYLYAAPTMTVAIRAKGMSWQLSNTSDSTRWDVTLPTGKNDLVVQKVVSYLPLRDADKAGITYLDVAVEPKGYIYVLMVEQTIGAPTFMLDIYNPDGSVLLKQPQTGVNAAKLTVDQWRSMFTLNFNVVLGPNGRTEPGVSQWIPSTPDPATKG